MSLPAELFRPAGSRPTGAETVTRESTTFWQDAWRRFKKNPLALAGLLFIIFLLLVAAIVPYIVPFSYSDQDLNYTNQPPSAEHWFGTDTLGRDLFIRVVFGARISLAVGIGAALINLTIGVTYGAISGFSGGRVDNIMMRVVDILYGIPLLLFVILLMVIFRPGLLNVFIALGAVYWLDMARIVRGQVLALKEQEFVLAARTLGARPGRIMFRHLIPNSLGPIIVTSTLGIPAAIFAEAWLSYLGLGVTAPVASWGVLISEAVQGMRSYPLQLLFPALAICLTMLGFNFVGDGLRDAFDPRQRR
jgi:oligopeptide transport system permease protein